MKTRKYHVSGKELAVKQPMVREAKAEAYVREKDRKKTSRVALNIASVKRRLKKPAERSKRDIAWALDIVGIGEGPEDLSDHMRDYPEPLDSLTRV